MNDLVNNTHKYDVFFPNKKRPPTVCRTRWTTFLVTSCYYKENFTTFKELILSENFDVNSDRNRKLKELMNNKRLKDDLESIGRAYKPLINFVKESEKNGFSIKDCCEMFYKITFNDDPANIKDYFNSRWSKNESLELWNNYLKNPNDIFLNTMINCPGTSVDVERIFSHLDYLLNTRRHFKDENVIRYLVKLLYYDH